MDGLLRRLVANFFQGLLFITPIAVTVYVVVWFVNMVDDFFDPLIHDYVPFHIPGLGIILAFIMLALIGYVVSNLISRSALGWFERMMNRAPLIKVIYFSVKDILNVFFKKEDQLGKPVKVLVQENPKQWRFGFVTGSDLDHLGFDDSMISVYLPFSYGIMGNLLIVEKRHVEMLDEKPSDVMKLIVSGGVTKIEDKNLESSDQTKD